MKFKILKLLILTIVLVISKCRKPNDRQKQEVWRLQCELGFVDDIDCPIYGGWTSWSPWSVCKGSCDQIGHKTRTRDCTNPPPSPGGIACSGPDEQTESCHIINCTANDFRLLVEGDSARTEALQQLETVPALMDRCLPAECMFQAIEAALSMDNTWQLNPENVWNALLCVKHNMGCPVIGEWGVWGEWSTCGARCGSGWKWRLRRCDTPSPSEARYVCSGSPLDSKPCEGDQCAIERRSTSGAWSDWGKWSACSENCGVGVKRRRRTCLENQTPLISGSWGTHCRGQHDQLQECKKKQCALNGGWSGWGDWGPCSKTCGAGKRSRSRSCTRPIPSGGGETCAGPKTEVGSCYLAPCDVYTHTVALFNGESFLEYDFGKKTSTLTHFFIRFMPLSPQGTLMLRGNVYGPYVLLSIHNWHICIDVSGMNKDCSVPKICTHDTIEPAVWHTAMVTLTTQSVTLRLDDNLWPILNTFSCDPSFPEYKVNLVVGEKFYGEIQEVIFNFTPLYISVDKVQASTKSDLFPAVASNAAYELANMEEGIVFLDKEYFFRIPCFADPDDWKMELTLKPSREYGTILFLSGVNEWLHISLQNSRVRVKLALGDYRSESLSATECPKDQWLDVTITKQFHANSIETLINGGERIHVLLDSDMDRKRRKSQDSCEKSLTYPDGSSSVLWVGRSKLALCIDEYFVGGVPVEVKKKVSEIFTPLYGYIASISLNSILYDIHAISQERSKANRIQLSSRTASVSDFYRETTWGQSHHLNLSCLHARKARSSNSGLQWLSLDTGLYTHKDILGQRKENDRVLRLGVKPDKDLRGFYTCRAYSGKNTHNIITYGVIGKTRNKLSEPETTTAIAVFTTLALVTCTLVWLLAEAVHDIRHGHGFFRDNHLRPEQIFAAICVFIENNQELIGGTSAVELSRARAQRSVLSRTSELNFGAQEPQGLLQETRLDDENVPAGLDLPTLPEGISLELEAPRNLFRFEPNYISTPQHGSITSPRKKLTSSSSLEVVSPRVLCSRIIAAKCRLSPRESVASQRKQVCCPSITRKARSNIWKATIAKKKAAENILNMFRRLQKDT